MSEGEWKAKAKEITDVNEREAFKKYWSQIKGGESELLVWRYIEKIPKSIPLALFHNFDLRMFHLFTGIPASSSDGKNKKTSAPSSDGTDKKTSAPSSDGTDKKTSASSSDGTDKKTSAPLSDGKNKKTSASLSDGTDKKTSAPSSDGKNKKDNSVHHLPNQEFDFLLILPEYRFYCHLEVKAAEKVNGSCIDQLERGRSFFKMVQEYLGEEEYKDWKFIPVSVFPNDAKVRP
ncbi:uncharacterized protein LOC111715972 [Eurytemora carolleeae]|uniref:uncharacterized protein LOC111715972 n=1 Tax=Eurytemora carolleeae TaxID=1294199 RepID=UPI000C760BA1|nr:uncharacterized protein LOC111715972 [Eurytemora carolleeae]|eukprot:XP_023347146.1 uncharacterized protein LOC111715972 [Eurytemora affinis]